MESASMSIGELAALAGLTRRAVRFYVQQQLLPAPTGVGRGRHYNQSHLDRLGEIAQLQAAGHSLDAIRRIIDGENVQATKPVKLRSVPRPALSAELWTRITLGEGLELQFDAKRFQPDVQGLVELRELARRVFADADP